MKYSREPFRIRDVFQKRMNAKRLGPIETLRLKFLGRSNGKAGRLKQSLSGEWGSPWLSGQDHDYNEFCYKVWAAAESELAETYQSIGMRIEAVRRKEALLLQYRQAPTNAGNVYAIEIKRLEARLGVEYGRLCQRQTLISEINNMARLVCGRMRSHISRKRALYWEAACKNHPNKNQMPAAPAPLPESEAELVYTAQHKELEKETLDMLSRRSRLAAAYVPENNIIPIKEGVQ